jgi:hypothetical protein
MSGRHDHRDAIAKRASQIMKANPNMDRASASARAAYELDPVEKSAELTLAQVIDAVLNTAAESRVAKGAAGTWVDASAQTMQANPELLNLRSCGVANLRCGDEWRTIPSARSCRNSTGRGIRCQTGTGISSEGSHSRIASNKRSRVAASTNEPVAASRSSSASWSANSASRTMAARRLASQILCLRG